MTQPTIDFEDGTFPQAEVSEIDRLTAAVRDLTSAVDNLAAEVSLRPDSSPKTQITVSDRVPSGSVFVGDFSADWGDPSVRRIDPADQEAVEEFWEDFAGVGEMGDVRAIHDALVGPASEPVGVPATKTVVSPEPEPAWHDAVAVIATGYVGDGDWITGVWVPDDTPAYWESAEMGVILGCEKLSDVTPLIEAKATGAMIDRILDVIAARFDNYPAGIGEELAAAALGLEAE